MIEPVVDVGAEEGDGGGLDEGFDDGVCDGSALDCVGVGVGVGDEEDRVT